jgi:hypothetical protein
MPAAISKADLSAVAQFLRSRIDSADTNHDGQLDVKEASALVESIFPGRVDLFDHLIAKQDSTADLVIGTLLPMTRVDTRASFATTSLAAAKQLVSTQEQQALAAPAPYSESYANPYDWLVDASIRVMDSPVFARDPASAGVVSAADAPSATEQSSSGDSLSGVVASLETQIRTLEDQNTQKMNEVNELVSQIAARENQLKQQANSQRTIGIVGALFGAPMVGVLGAVTAIQTDGQLKDLHAKLTEAQADQARMQQKMTDYKAFKATVERTVAQLQQSMPEPARPSFDPATPSAVKKLLMKVDAVSQAQARVANLTAQRDALLPLRDQASALGADLDATLSTLAQELADAQRAVDAAKKATLNLLLTLASPDPEAAAMKKLAGMAKAQVQKALDPMVERMVSDVKDPKLKAELKNRLSSELMNGLFRSNSEPAGDAAGDTGDVTDAAPPS